MTEVVTRMRAYRVALDPTADQRAALASHAGANRAAFNYRMNVRDLAYKQWKQLVAEATYERAADGAWAITDPAAAYAAARKNVRVKPEPQGVTMKRFKIEHDWAHEVNLYAFSSGMRACDAAWSNWIASASGKRQGPRVGYPRFRSRRTATDRFTLFHSKVKPTLRPVGSRRLNLPKKVGGAIRLHGNIRVLARRIERGTAVISSVTITRGGKYWWASILVEETEPQPRTRPSTHQQAAGSVGVDWGINHLATLSNGTVFENPRHLRKAQKRLKKAQRDLSRKGWYRQADGALIHNVTTKVRRDPTSGRRKAQRKVALLHAEVAAARAGAIHQITKHLATTHSMIAVEDLNVRGMTTRPHPRPHTTDSTAAAGPGFEANGARSKAGLNRSILDAAPGEFRRQLAYKTSWYGSTLVVIDRWAPTSKTCSDCGSAKAKLGLSERTYHCTECGMERDRDLNAARNIHALGQHHVACDTRETLQAPSLETPNPQGPGGKRRWTDPPPNPPGPSRGSGRSRKASNGHRVTQSDPVPRARTG